MDVRQRRYRPISSQQRQQSIPQNNQTQQRASEEPLQIQEMTHYVQDLLQNGISTDFIYDRSKLMMFLMAIVIIGFYIFLVGNLRAEANVRNLPSSHKQNEIVINGNRNVNQKQLIAQNHNLNDTRLENSQMLVQNKMQENNTTKISNHKDIKQEMKEKTTIYDHDLKIN